MLVSAISVWEVAMLVTQQRIQRDRPVERWVDIAFRAGGALVAAAFSFLGEMLPRGTETDASVELAREIRECLTGCLAEDPQGALQLRVTLPDRGALDALAGVLARALAGRVGDA